jgi:hypothetical protein
MGSVGFIFKVPFYGLYFIGSVAISGFYRLYGFHFVSFIGFMGSIS